MYLYLFNLALHLIFSILFLPSLAWVIWDHYRWAPKKRFIKTKKTLTIVGFLLVIFAYIYQVPIAISYLKDIPYVISQDYKIVQGEITNIRRSKDARYITVDDYIELEGIIEYKLRNKYHIIRFYYLPNTHVIIKTKGIS